MKATVTEAINRPVADRTTQTMFARVVRSMRRFVALAIWGLIAASLLLRFTVQDQYHRLAVLYYLTPLPTLPFLFFMAGCLWGAPLDVKPARFQMTRRRLSLIASLVCALWVVRSEFVVRAAPPGEAESTVVFWNTAHLGRSVDDLAEKLMSWQPAVIGLVEAEGYYPKAVAKWRKALPDYQIAPTHFGGLLAVKGTIVRQMNHKLTPCSWCDQFDLIVGSDSFTLLLVDISANLNLPRNQPLRDLADLARSLDDRPLIIMGDFNTPDDSPLLNPLRQTCQQAFRERGSGYAATWPMPFPVLTLDQVWFNRQVDVSRCDAHWSVYSDHRPLVSSVSFLREPDAPATAE
ncbi:endonuclease/exonuclease/phosphatase family protein [Schlesneria sp. DSM 10557]|uniref:endonuclease/exonuclease/phosphatase family protein n=1 Tax=Schlesneria sp. DSM 10557 TaxID=3044399 RepID=UPI0035A0D4B0